ncbi:universal stress protein [Sorangium cellulosum]|uniref:Universal stress protein n=1 Tax=Sorangium cellulosum TaxID=56 RepID=A0A2L0ESP1_SORCE|nr:universal stress protein [Sorangium cellulosum]AUX42327.1 universal stress protein [Sorangium cellulosum]
MNDASKRILVPVDLGEESSSAVALAADLAQRIGGEVVMMHVYTLPQYAYAGVNIALVPETVAKIGAIARRALEGYAKDHGGVHSLLREGDPAEEILGAIASERPYMVVMSTHRRKGISRLLLGSVADKVARRSPVPVMTVARGPARARRSAEEPEAYHPSMGVKELELAVP